MGYKDLKFPKSSFFRVTGVAGFIGSNLFDNPNHEFIKGDIRDFDICIKACEGVDYVLNQAAWGVFPAL
jgi:UDP-N-acetylglucosamine 4-epimerase